MKNEKFGYMNTLKCMNCYILLSLTIRVCNMGHPLLDYAYRDQFILIYSNILLYHIKMSLEETGRKMLIFREGSYFVIIFFKQECHLICTNYWSGTYATVLRRSFNIRDQT